MKVTSHPNGFLKVVVWERDDGSSHRIHAWDEAGGDSDIHQHRADFSSVVVEGEMAEEIYGFADEKNGGWDHLEANCWQDGGGGYHVDIESSVHCRPVLLRTEIHRAGETFDRPAVDLHRVIAVKVPLVTVVTFGPAYQQVHTILRRR